MRHIIGGLIAGALFAAPGVAAAQEDTQLWTGAGAVVEPVDRVRLSYETVARFSDRRDGLYEIEASVMTGYRIDPRLTIWVGYTHDPNYAGGRFTVMERRFRQQVTWDNVPLGPGRFNARLRLEQRWRDGVGGPAWRVRPFMRFMLPFSTGGRTGLVLSHESFIDLNTTSFQRVEGEERMRNMIGVTTPLARRLTLEAGYLDQHSFVPGAPDNDDHALTLALAASF